MAILLQQFNPNTLKASYNSTTKKGRVFTTCANCDPSCTLGYVPGDNICGGKGIPNSLCAVVWGMKRCLDDSTITSVAVCLDYVGDAGFGFCHCWSGTTTIDEAEVTVLYRTDVCINDTDCHVYDADSVWFWSVTGGPCGSVNNDLLIGDCGNEQGDIAECDGTLLTRTVVAYAGQVQICNPNTAEIWLT